MKIVVSCDEYLPILRVLFRKLEEFGHDFVYFGPLKEGTSFEWTSVTIQAIDELKKGQVEEAIVLCWTGTGCTLIANKVQGVRAALCVDGESAKGARIWNHANVLGLSLRLLSEKLIDEILFSWFETPYSTDSWNLAQIEAIRAVEERK